MNLKFGKRTARFAHCGIYSEYDWDILMNPYANRELLSVIVLEIGTKIITNLDTPNENHNSTISWQSSRPP